MNKIIEIKGCLSVETFDGRGNVVKKNSFKNFLAVLCRNEFRDIVLKISTNSAKACPCHFVLKDFKTFTKFIKQGKASIRLLKEKKALLFSNCAVSSLQLFFNTLLVKHACQKESKNEISDRKRLLSDAQRIVQDISPVCQSDVTALRASKNQTGFIFKSPIRSPLQSITNKVPPPSLTSSTPKAAARSQTMKKHFTVKKRPSLDFTSPPKKKSSTSSSVKSFSSCSVSTSASSIKSLSLSVRLTADQEAVVARVLRGRNIFFTGSAGTGKTLLLRKIISMLPPNTTFATASTGVAACHIGGITLHSFAGIGSGKGPLEECLSLARRPGVEVNWKRASCLIIDEISMIDADYFTKLERVASLMKDPSKPFGGIQLIVCGDFLQLPPVCKENTGLNGGTAKNFCFRSPAWNRCIEDYIRLTKVHRQTDDEFIQILQEIRVGRCSDKTAATLERTFHNDIAQNEDGGLTAIQLCTHRRDVEFINSRKIKRLNGEVREYTARDSEPTMTDKVNNLTTIPQTLSLKIGAQVMLVKNFNVQIGLVNGARGIVVGFDVKHRNYPIVTFACGVTQTVSSEKTPVNVGVNHTVFRKQVPLCLAWAISIHKSQGMTLDNVEISISRIFEAGQAYVALSRVRGLEGLRVVDFARESIRADAAVLNFYRNCRWLSANKVNS